MSHPYESVKCPECNGEMVSRTGKYGVFWGCKAFPNCKGTRDNQGRSKADKAKERGEEYVLDSSEANQQSFNENKPKTTFNKGTK